MCCGGIILAKMNDVDVTPENIGIWLKLKKSGVQRISGHMINSHCATASLSTTMSLEAKLQSLEAKLTRLCHQRSISKHVCLLSPAKSGSRLFSHHFLSGCGCVHKWTTNRHVHFRYFCWRAARFEWKFSVNSCRMRHRHLMTLMPALFNAVQVILAVSVHFEFGAWACFSRLWWGVINFCCIEVFHQLHAILCRLLWSCGAIGWSTVPMLSHSMKSYRVVLRRAL